MLLLAGCANLAARDRALLLTAKSCCSGIETLPAATAIRAESAVKFRPESPHFDFGIGLGLTPFVRFALQPGELKAVTILSVPEAGGHKLAGGTGGLRYVDARPIFFDVSGAMLPPAAVSPPTLVLRGFLGTFTYVRSVNVPATAAALVVASSTTDIGREGVLRGGQQDVIVPVGGAFVNVGGAQRVPYTLALYGDVDVLPVSR